MSNFPPGVTGTEMALAGDITDDDFHDQACEMHAQNRPHWTVPRCFCAEQDERDLYFRADTILAERKERTPQ